VQLLGNTTDLRPRYIHALEILNRVNEEKFIDIISLLQVAIDAHTTLKNYIYTNIINTASSKTGRVYDALDDYVTTAKNELKVSVPLLIQNYQTCYDRNVDYIIKGVTGQISTSVQQLSSLQMILGQTSNISSDGYSYLNSSAQQIIFVQNFLINANGQLSTAANYSYCPENPLQTSCAMLWWNLNTTMSNFSTSLFQLNPGNAGMFNTTSQPTSQGASSTTISTTSTQSASVYPDQTTEYDIGTTYGPSSSSNTIPLAQQAKQAQNSSNMKTKASQQVMTNLSTCLTSYQLLLDSCPGILNTISLDISATSVAISSTILSKLSNDGDWLQGLLNGYLAGSLSAVDVAIMFLGVQSTNVLLNVAQTLSTIDESTMTILQNLINTEKSELKQSYSQIMTSLSDLDAFMPNADSTIDNFARNFSLWKKPTAGMQSQDVRLLNLFLNSKSIIRSMIFFSYD